MPDQANSPDHVEAEEVLRIGVTEIGIGDHGMVEQHHQRQEGAGAIERKVSRFGLGHRAHVGLPSGGNRCHARLPARMLPLRT
jgi:hypothetical protein